MNKGPAKLVLLKNDMRLERPERSVGSPVDRPFPLQLIDCRPSLFDLLRRDRRARPLREVTERAFARFAHSLAAKLRR